MLASTTYVGCTRELVVGPLQARGLVVGQDVFVAFSPERIDPGVAAHVPERTPRVVGGVTEECARRAIEVLSRTASELYTVSSPEAVLRPDPAHRARLVEIRDNLHARIAEARREGWLGEVDGLQISLNGARQKLAQLDQTTTSATGAHLGMPSFPQIAGRSVPTSDIPT